MAENRFKKSITNATENTKDNIVDNIVDNMSENTVENIKDNIVTNTGDDILKKVLQGNKKDKGGNHTIYLSADVGDSLIKYAKKANKSKSELVDSILREIFKL